MAATDVQVNRLAGVLFGVCFASAAMLVGFDQFTKPLIQKAQAEKTERARKGVLPAGTEKLDQDFRKDEEAGTPHPFTLDLSASWDPQSGELVKILDRDQEKAKAIQVYRGYDKAGKVTGYALVGELPDGYSGDIRFILGVRYDPEIDGFRVSGSKILSHKETPGLGANIISVTYEEDQKAAEEHRDAVPYFLARFVDRKLEEVGLAKDGHPGNIEALTAATITSRAFAGAVRRILELCNRNKAALLHPAGSGGGQATVPVPDRTTERRG